MKVSIAVVATTTWGSGRRLPVESALVGDVKAIGAIPKYRPSHNKMKKVEKKSTTVSISLRSVNKVLTT